MLVLGVDGVVGRLLRVQLLDELVLLIVICAALGGALRMLVTRGVRPLH